MFRCGLDGTCAIWFIKVAFDMPSLSMVTVCASERIMQRGPRLRGHPLYARV